MKRFWSVFIFVFVLAGLASAQNQPDDYNKVEIFAGYSAGVHANGDDSLDPTERGFNVSAVYNFHRFIGVKADVSRVFSNITGGYYSNSTLPVSLGSYRARHTLSNYTAGIQFKNNRREARFKPFAHILVGVGEHKDKFKTACPTGAVCPPFNIDFTGVSLIVGGGLDIKINRRIDIRAVQLDLNPIFYKYNQQNTTWYNTRFSTGIIFKF
jgi:hypothetical protein